MRTEVAAAAEHTIPLSGEFAARLYADTRPHNQLTSSLQKGLILISNGQELAGEGIGFGVPAVRHRDRTYFSSRSSVKYLPTRNHTTVIKKFTLNLVSERTLRNARIETATVRKIKRTFEHLYMKNKHLTPLILEDVIRRIGVKRNFVEADPISSARMTYIITQSNIKVKAEFKFLRKGGVNKIYVLNEQGSTHFRKYYDSNGTVLYDHDIGAWQPVNADWACIYSSEHKLGFRLRKHDNTTLYRGREFLNSTHDWIGLEYETTPRNTCFEYDIELVRS